MGTEIPRIVPVSNGWSEWGKHILKELERLDTTQQGLVKEIQLLVVEVATLKVKMMLIVSGTSIVISFGVSLLVLLLKSKMP